MIKNILPMTISVVKKVLDKYLLPLREQKLNFHGKKKKKKKKKKSLYVWWGC